MFELLFSSAKAEAAFEVIEVELTAEQSVLSLLFSILPMIILGVFVVAPAIIIPVSINSAKKKKQMLLEQQKAASASVPVQYLYATAITKRNPRGNEYYVGFQLENGQRIELRVPGAQYGVILEGDKGMLHLRDNAFVGFDRA